VFGFFFQAEDGIRDDLVTGVQTCALPIYDQPRTRRHHGDVRRLSRRRLLGFGRRDDRHLPAVVPARLDRRAHPRPLPEQSERTRSEERRVGKERRYRWTLERATTEQKCDA